jgi:tetratricopeptide (TPR) repeat protein
VASVAELLSIYETTESLAEAKDALDRIAAMEHPADLELGEFYDELSEIAADNGDYELAVQAQRLAIEHGCRMQDLAREMLAWYLLKAGETEEGEAIFATELALRGHDAELHGTVGAARADAGDHEGALRAFDRALELAESGAGPEPAASAAHRWPIRRFREERRECLLELGLQEEEGRRVAGITAPGFPEAEAYAVAWFPRGEVDAALTRWPSLAGDLADPDAYCAIIEGRLREVRAATGRVPSVAPLKVEALGEFAAAHGLDPETGEARSQLAAVLGSCGATIGWPPGRNDSCWCGSGRKYKRCCG